MKRALMAWTHTHRWKLGAPPAAVFAALTDAEELQTWFAEGAEVNAIPGGDFRFWGRHTLGAPGANEATRASVFRTLIEPALVNRWFGSTQARVVPAPGGEYRLGWEYKVDGRDVVGGTTTILEFVRDQKLVLDWLDWRGDAGALRARRLLAHRGPRGLSVRVGGVPRSDEAGDAGAAPVDSADVDTRRRWTTSPLSDLCIVWTSAWPTGLARGIPFDRPQRGGLVAKFVRFLRY